MCLLQANTHTRAYGRYLLIAVGCVRWYQKKLKEKNVSTMLVGACMRVAKETYDMAKETYDACVCGCTCMRGACAHF